MPPLRPVPLSELRLQTQGRHWPVDQAIAGLASLTPVRGEVVARHHGSALEVSGVADTIVTLCCDRCLQPFNHPLHAEARELLQLRDAEAAEAPRSAETPLAADAELFLLGEDLDDRLDPLGLFDPEQWLFEQLSLRLPLVNRCGSDCPGPPSWGDPPPVADPRWATLRTLRPG
ncbi:MAG: YceD family protein [Synechococcaceae cyanobacterium]|nr:YceD family protein [Synechococcaceae cyanobacterium]